MLRACACLLFLALLACTEPASEPGRVPEKYRYLAAPVSSDHVPVIRSALPFEKLELEEYSTTKWSGTKVTFWRDGRAERGDETGEVSIFEYGELCYLLERSGFESLDAEYPSGSPHHLVTLRAWRDADRDPVEVLDVMGQGPSELWTIQRAFEGVATRIHWSPR